MSIERITSNNNNNNIACINRRTMYRDMGWAERTVDCGIEDQPAHTDLLQFDIFYT